MITILMIDMGYEITPITKAAQTSQLLQHAVIEIRPAMMPSHREQKSYLLYFEPVRRIKG